VFSLFFNAEAEMKGRLYSRENKSDVYFAVEPGIKQV
jgi:hypothetical protein